MIQKSTPENVFVKYIQRNKLEQIMSYSTQAAELAADEKDMMSL